MRQTTAALVWGLRSRQTRRRRNSRRSPCTSSSHFPRAVRSTSPAGCRKELQERWGHRSSSRTSPEAPSVRVRREERAGRLHAHDHQLDPARHASTSESALRSVEGPGRRDADHALTYAFVVNPTTGSARSRDLDRPGEKEPGGSITRVRERLRQHLYVELRRAAADMNLTHVPYKGAAPARRRCSRANRA